MESGLRKLRPKEIEIIELLNKKSKSISQTTIAFEIDSNHIYTKYYLEELEKLGLVEKIKVGKKYTAWKIKQREESDRLPPLTTKNG